VIACGCIYLAARRAGVALPTAPPWWRLVDGAVLEDLEIVAKTLLALYEIDEKFKYIDLGKPQTTTATHDHSRHRRRSRSPTRGDGERRVRRRDSRDFRDRSRD
jgi:hypothetical protein